MEGILDSVYTLIHSVLEAVADEQTKHATFNMVIHPSMEELKRSLMGKVTEILQPRVSGHPITYNHYLTETVQKKQSYRNRKNLSNRLKSQFNVRGLAEGYHGKVNLVAFLDLLSEHTEPDMDRYACSMAADMMMAYYQVSAPLQRLGVPF